eukprot:scaffold65682_cov82-Phaeocystis_antarctica.AAC.1
MHAAARHVALHLRPFFFAVSSSVYTLHGVPTTRCAGVHPLRQQKICSGPNKPELLAYHKGLKVHRKNTEDGGVMQQQQREAAERAARRAAQTGDEYEKLMAEGVRYAAQQDTRRAARAYREAIALRPDRPEAYYGLGAALNNSGHYVEAAQRFLEARERYQVGSEGWAMATARVFSKLTQEECAEVAKPEWWNDEGLKALSARVVRAAPDDVQANQMWALVLSGLTYAWEAGPRSAAELKEAATHFDRAAALHPAPAVKGS